MNRSQRSVQTTISRRPISRPVKGLRCCGRNMWRKILRVIATTLLLKSKRILAMQNLSNLRRSAASSASRTAFKIQCVYRSRSSTRSTRFALPCVPTRQNSRRISNAFSITGLWIFRRLELFLQNLGRLQCPRVIHGVAVCRCWIRVLQMPTAFIFLMQLVRF